MILISTRTLMILRMKSSTERQTSVFKTLSNNCDGAFYENSSRLKVIFARKSSIIDN